MHVEAMRWCGLNMQACARAHGISQHSLKRWRDLIDANEVEIDWRTQLHPSAHLLSTNASSAAKEYITGTRLKGTPIVDPPDAGRANRRRFSDEEKARDRARVRTTRRDRGRGLPTPRHRQQRAVPVAVQFGFGKRP